MTDDEKGQPESGTPGPEDVGSEEEVGSVAEEAAKLFGALSGWAREHGEDLGTGASDLASGAAHALREVNEHIATDSDECRYCPVCRTLHLVRDLSPEVKSHLAVASASLIQAAAALMATAAPDQGKTSSTRGEDIEKIDLDD